MNDSAQSQAPRLGIIISMFPELHETFILRELVALEQCGVSFEIFSLQRPRDPITLEDAIRLSTQRTSYSGIITSATMLALFRVCCTKPLRLFRAIAKLVIHGRDRPVEIAKNLAILPLSLYIAEQGKKRNISHWHGHWANIPTTACWYLGQIHDQSWSAAIHGEDIFSANRFLKYKLDESRFTVVCSGFFCHHLKTQLNLEQPENIHLNYHGLDPLVTTRARVENSDSCTANQKLTLVSIGRLVPTKGHDIVIKACSLLERAGLDFELQLVGSGPLEQDLKSLVVSQGLGQRVNFKGALAFGEVLSILEGADIFVLAPRLIDGHPPDGIPNVIAEAMALGVPVVATRVSAIPELVIDQTTGCLVESEDIVGVAKAVKQLVASPNYANQLRDAAREHVAKMFNQESNISELLDLFDQYTGTRFIGASA
ncbi:MAG: glycosyltransferase family 4 protein [Granulosicoccus sp.]|nr:glycosyltransferase family 4 protein [Granulosicoccus sp.]